MSNIKHICPIAYTEIDPQQKYSIEGLRKLSPTLQNLQALPYSTEQQIIEARNRADKMSIQGVQPKLSARLDTKNQIFELCDSGGTYILKPQNQGYHQLPENEDLTMHLAAEIIEVPVHGLLYCIDGKFTYFIKRFDRGGRGHKIPLEDFAQLSGFNRETKYNSSMEKLIPIIDKYCTFPAIQKIKLFNRVVFNYLIGNEDMHLKNYSLISRDGIIELSPAYDFINTTIAIGINRAKEQIALPLNGKKNNLTKRDILEYYGLQKLSLQESVMKEALNKFRAVIPRWHKLIAVSFLSEQGKKDYRLVLDERSNILEL